MFSSSSRRLRSRFENVVKGKLLPLDLLGACDGRATDFSAGVKGCVLMRVFSVAEILDLLELKIQGLTELSRPLFPIQRVQIVGDRSIVVSRMAKGLACQSKARPF